MKKLSTPVAATAMSIAIVGAFSIPASAQTHVAHRRAIHSSTTAAPANETMDYRFLSVDDIRANYPQERYMNAYTQD